MNYKNAFSILPQSLVEELQTYIQGEYLYIPKKEDQHKRWAIRPEAGSKLPGAMNLSETIIV